MLNLKKTAVAVLALSSSAVFAGTMGPVCTATNVTVPCERSAWDIGITALYLKPTSSAVAAYTLPATTVGAAAPFVVSATWDNVDPRWGWGFKLEGSYHFNTGNDVNLNWYHFKPGQTSRNFGAFGAGAFTIGALTVPAETVTTEVSPQWDAVNLEFGQHVDFGPFVNVRLHAGGQYAYIKTNGEIETLTEVNGYLFSAYSTSKLSAFGPRLGADAYYDFGNGFSVYGKAAGALLAGTSKFTGSFVDNAGDSLYTSGSNTVVVPELEGKLGASYTYAMAQGDLTLDAGWMWVNYINAQTVLSVAGPLDSDFGVTGPYIGLKWVGSVV